MPTYNLISGWDKVQCAECDTRFDTQYQPRCVLITDGRQYVLSKNTQYLCHVGLDT